MQLETPALNRLMQDTMHPLLGLVNIVNIMAVLLPGLIPANPPYFLKFSAVSVGLKVISIKNVKNYS